MTQAPLAGIRILDMTRLLPGNYCVWLLASLGAEVIKVEDPGAGDYMRTLGQQVAGQSGVNHMVNRGKRSIVIDLKNPDGVDTLLRLSDQVDVVVESFRPGVLDRLGVGPEVMRARHPKLVIASISGYGATGPLSREAAHDINALAFSGLLAQWTHNDGGVPEPCTTPIADLIGGSLIPAIGVLGLLVRARETGIGGHLDASLAEGVALLPSILSGDVLAGYSPPPPGTPEWAGFACYRVYRLTDAQVAVGAVEEVFWRDFCEAIGEPELVSMQWDPDAQDYVSGRIERRLGELSAEEYLNLIEGRQSCTNLVNDLSAMIASDHARARQFTRPSVDAPMEVLAPPFMIDGARPPETLGSPGQGQHTVEILREFGFEDAQINALIDSGGVDQRDPANARSSP